VIGRNGQDEKKFWLERGGNEHLETRPWPPQTMYVPASIRSSQSLVAPIPLAGRYKRKSRELSKGNVCARIRSLLAPRSLVSGLVLALRAFNVRCIFHAFTGSATCVHTALWPMACGVGIPLLYTLLSRLSAYLIDTMAKIPLDTFCHSHDILCQLPSSNLVNNLRAFRHLSFHG
jgi:hypothetical protein